MGWLITLAERKQLSSRGGLLNFKKPSFAWPVCCSAWFGLMNYDFFFALPLRNCRLIQARLLVIPAARSVRSFLTACSIASSPFSTTSRPKAACMNK